MARLHGRRGSLYVGLASSTAAAEQVAFLNQWSIDFSVDDADATAFGDTNKVYLAGLPDAAGSFKGFYDDATVQVYTAASDGAARRVYLYPATSNTGQYWFGTALFDFNVDVKVSGAIDVGGKFKAASAFTKVG